VPQWRFSPPHLRRPTIPRHPSPQNAPVEKLDADTFQVQLTNLVVPTSELRIGFFDVPEVKSPEK
jgi:hypothetical protein